ncbi:hypothetical protein CALVIDRAFT_547339 [Calocera viscosa TUFC12733]|uniref:Uroporphyrin-III C-methyltransferase n=1 Tax=Calocera viscosa (strain TUFC12733) TaxID=1330018 RepID=A0A167H5Y4_CALVF|nr:hypothetical protein CALVIDRAFT_547339 [Calocera viscosa TUFC12733]
MLVCIADTLVDDSPARRTLDSATRVAEACRHLHIPVTVADTPHLCDFTFPSTYRGKSSLQLALTANGQGCRLASRIRRQVVRSLPPCVGDAVEAVGKLRRLAKAADFTGMGRDALHEFAERDEDASYPSAPLNRPVPQLSASTLKAEEEERTEAQRRRMRWVAQVSEYWSFERLARMGEGEMRELLRGRGDAPVVEGKKWRILLVGSGPGHPSLLTIAAHTALTKLATVVLSDKLVPAEILALIPPTTPLHIAKKFPGNAEGAQSELISLALDAARRGETVVRLKQGDPFLYGRGGEELLAFRAAGFPPLILPGISSALAGPLLADIPVTQRGVAESVAICTGVGRGGRDVELPAYERSRTTVLLMGVARLAKLVERMLSPQLAYPKNIPIAIIERASSPDQRVLLSTLEHVVDAVELAGEARVPGMICVGWACACMSGEEGELTVLMDGLEECSGMRKSCSESSMVVFEGMGDGHVFAMSVPVMP